MGLEKMQTSFQDKELKDRRESNVNILATHIISIQLHNHFSIIYGAQT